MPARKDQRRPVCLWAMMIIGMLLTPACNPFRASKEAPGSQYHPNVPLQGHYLIGWMSSSNAALLHEGDDYGGAPVVETEVYAYAVTGNWIAGKSARGWFLVNWQTHEHVRLGSKEEFVAKLRELGLDPSLKLKALYKDKRGRPY